MKSLELVIFAQSALMFGLAGLFWPEKFMPLFDVLMFPWPASHRAIRVHGIVSIAGYVLVLARVVAFA